MFDRPIILFPKPEVADREKISPNFTKINKPSFSKQFERLQPQLSVLRDAFERKNFSLQESPTGINPDLALVFEVVDTVNNFYTAIKNCEDLEWIFDSSFDGIDPDEDFYEVERATNKAKADKITGKVYCVMSNKQAMDQLINLWERHSRGEEQVFKRGFTGLRDIFINIKNIRKWNENDRIEETHAMEYWKENLASGDNRPIPFEIELFYRSEDNKREKAREPIIIEITKLGGKVLQECVIKEIAYHALLVQLPPDAIEQLVKNYKDIQLAQVDDIMFFRPICQSSFPINKDTSRLDVEKIEGQLPQGNPVIAILDGMPLQNHSLLRGRLIIDDPDAFENNYLAESRMHGTAMASLVIYGDLNKHQMPIETPVYIRPILRPKEFCGEYFEQAPEGILFTDLIHRAITRMFNGENKELPTAPTVKVINFSIGDPSRQLTSLMSPLGRLLDYLSYKYKVLFIVSAGNHAELIDNVEVNFKEFKNSDLPTRNKIIYECILENQRNTKVLAPAENINGLTIGALYDDLSIVNENDRCAFVVERGLPCPASSYGKGYRSIITPDLFYNGGRKFVIEDVSNGSLTWAIDNHEPGCKVAAPYQIALSDGQSFSSGTSNATAQITHESLICNKVINDVFQNETGAEVPDEFKSILIKAMLTHGASWDEISDPLADALNYSKKKLSSWLGNGVPMISKIESCSKERVTLLGFGKLEKDKGHVFDLPLPIDFSSQLIKRRMTVTLAYFSPINCQRYLYRSAQIWYDVDDTKGLVPHRQNSEWRSVRRGTLQHEIFEGEDPIVWSNSDTLKIKVNCKEDAGKINHDEIPYGIFVTFEIAEGLDIDIYQRVAEIIKPRIVVTSP